MTDLKPFQILPVVPWGGHGIERHSLHGDHGGWAYAYVDDLSGVLCIVSDWETWSYRWHATPSALGAPTLTHFLGQRVDADYTGRKLTSEHGRGSGPARSKFDSDATLRSLRKKLCENRLDAGRNGTDRHRGLHVLTKARARELWDALEDSDADTESEDLFMSWYTSIPAYDLIDDDYTAVLEYEPTNSYMVLTKCILPALFTSCAQVVAARQAAERATVHACEFCS